MIPIMITNRDYLLNSSFQQAVIRNINDRNAQLQKQLENVVREANGEISLLSNKVTQFERDLEIERRKVRDLQDASRERDKEYQKLKIQHDKLRRKALLGPASAEAAPQSRTPESHPQRIPHNGGASGAVLDMSIGGLESSGIQRTPLVPTRAQNHAFTPVHVTQQQGSGWTKPLSRQMGSHHRQPFAGPSMPISDYSYRSTTGSERSDSGNEVEKILIGSSSARITAGWGPAAARSLAFAPPVSKRTSKGFRPAVPNL